MQSNRQEINKAGLPRLYTTKEVAQLLCCSTHHVGDIRRAGFLIGTRYGKCWLYSDKTIEQFIRRSEGIDLSNFANLSEEGLKKKYGDLLQSK